MIVSKRMTAATLLGVIMAGAAALVKFRPSAGQTVAATTVPVTDAGSRGSDWLGDVIAKNADIDAYFNGRDD